MLGTVLRRTRAGKVAHHPVALRVRRTLEPSRSLGEDGPNARAASNREGAFMGFHAQRVGEGAQRMLDKLAEVLAAPT